MRTFKNKLIVSAVLCVFGVAGSALAQEKSVEVVHWWTSGGEAAAVKVLKEDLVKRGIGWKDSAITGGAGDEARKVIRARAKVGNPPDSMQMNGFIITELAEEGLLGNIDEIANKEGWDKLVPAPLQKFSKFKGHWVSAPVNIHRGNWIWANKKIFDELKLTPPKTFEELVAVADKLRKAGYIPIAHGGQPWQDATLFDNAVMSAGGPKFYKHALIDLDPTALGSKTMEKAFEQMQKLRTMVDANFSGRDWNLASAMVINKKAGMQIMGDWAKGEFIKANQKPNVDFLCFAYPGTVNSFIFNSDQFVMFKVGDKQIATQGVFASAVMDKRFQEKFNLVKGSIPARTDVAMDNFEECGKQSMNDLKQAMKSDSMVGSFAHGNAMTESMKGIMMSVVSKFFNSGTSPADAVKELAAAVKKGK